MSENSVVNETLEIVKEAQSQGKFNLSDVIKGRGYPTKDISVYTDVESAFKLVELEERLAELDGKEYDELQLEANKLAEVVQASKLTFTMRGIPQAEIEKIERETNEKLGTIDEEQHNDEWFKHYMVALVASNIVKVTDSSGNVDEHLFTVEEVQDIRGYLPADSWNVLVNTMQKLTLATGFFDGLTDAGFLPKS